MKKQNRPLVIGVKGSKSAICTAGITPDFSSEELLNDAKRRLDAYYTSDKLARTSKIISSLDTYRGVIITAIKRFGAQFPSNAWSKYIELYTSISDIIGKPLINAVPGKLFNAFCNAELPGSSICALNHLFKTKYVDSPLNWIASSYKPDDVGTQLGDTYGLLKMNAERWLISDPSFNGDMTNAEIIKQCISMYRKRIPNGCDLYSHDAGIDVTKDIGKWKAYIDQESMNIPLHLGCAIAGLGTLAQGGSFIAKQYTLYRTVSIRLLGIYTKFFDEFYLIKPMTSRPGNSESYLVGIGFRLPDNHEELMNELYRIISLESPDADETKDEYYNCVIDNVNKYMDFSAGRQIVFLNQMINYLESDKEYDTTRHYQDINKWFKETGLKKLNKEDWIASSNK